VYKHKLKLNVNCLELKSELSQVFPSKKLNRLAVEKGKLRANPLRILVVTDLQFSTKGVAFSLSIKHFCNNSAVIGNSKFKSRFIKIALLTFSKKLVTRGKKVKDNTFDAPPIVKPEKLKNFLTATKSK